MDDFDDLLNNLTEEEIKELAIVDPDVSKNFP